MPNIPSITIGKYTLTRFINHTGDWGIWIEGECGEGMETILRKGDVTSNLYETKGRLFLC